MAQKYTLSHKNLAKIHCFKRTLKGIFPHDTLSHNFLINCNTLSHNFYQKRTPCRIIFTIKGHSVERHIPSSQVCQVWEYPPPPPGLQSQWITTRRPYSALNYLDKRHIYAVFLHFVTFQCALNRFLGSHIMLVPY